MGNWFILFVQTGREDEIASHLSSVLTHVVDRSIVPRKERVFRRRGMTIRERSIAFPGYVFLQSELSGKDFIKTTYKTIMNVSGVYKLLNYGSYEDIEVSEDEVSVLWRLCCNGLIEVSVGVIEGDKVRVVSGPLSEAESIIRKIDRHKRVAIVEIPVFGHLHTMVLPLEIVEKI